MNHPYWVTLGLLAVTAASWWGLMKLEAIEPKKPSKRRRGKRKRKKGRRRQTLKLLLHFSRRERLFAGGAIALVTWLVAVTAGDLLLAVMATVVLVVLHYRFQSLKK